MPTDLGDVLHYFIPEAETAIPEASAVRAARAAGGASPHGFSDPMRPAALPLIGVPIGEQDVVRAAFAWNLAVEIARVLGGPSSS